LHGSVRAGKLLHLPAILRLVKHLTDAAAAAAALLLLTCACCQHQALMYPFYPMPVLIYGEVATKYEQQRQQQK
jgi:hypothetical protein